MTALPHAVLEAARIQAGLSVPELWIAYFALGGGTHPKGMRAFLDGRAAPLEDYDVLAHAINERFVDRGENHPVPYWDELA